ncbi:unnamed protein product, partial [Callosobruchus maculatus]
MAVSLIFIFMFRDVNIAKEKFDLSIYR